MGGIVLIQKLGSVPLVMGMLTPMVTLRRDAIIPRFNVICVGLGLVMILADNGAERPLSFCSSRPLVAAST
jgi:hypothetical protein